MLRWLRTARVLAVNGFDWAWWGTTATAKARMRFDCLREDAPRVALLKWAREQGASL